MTAALEAASAEDEPLPLDAATFPDAAGPTPPLAIVEFPPTPPVGTAPPTPPTEDAPPKPGVPLDSGRSNIERPHPTASTATAAAAITATARTRAGRRAVCQGGAEGDFMFAPGL